MKNNNNKIRSKNNELEQILTILETFADQRAFADLDPRDFGANYDKQTDPEKKEYFVYWLRKNGYENIVTPKDEYCIYDISATKGGKQYIFELKKRTCLSTDYGDTIISMYKYRMLESFHNAGYKVKVVNLFKDCIHIHDWDSPKEFQDHYAQKTNNWNRSKTRKILVSYKNSKDSKYIYL